jgi:hypothetical protein
MRRDDGGHRAFLVPAADILGRLESALNAGQVSMIRFAISDHHVSHSMRNISS